MKRIKLTLLLAAACTVVLAQENTYMHKYDLLVSKLGPAGIGVETVLDNWGKVDSTSMEYLLARFNFWFAKSSSVEVVKKYQKKYLGMEPVLTLKDSASVEVYYYQESMYDDAIYGKAVKSIDKAIALYPDVLDLRFVKANAYIAYEKGSPDMALAYLEDLAEEDAARTEPWQYDGEEAGKEFFSNAIQEYCYSFYKIGTDASYEAFHSLSRFMLELHPGNAGFMNNIGTYLLVCRQDDKAALKQYNKVLKKYPEDYTAMKNAYIIAHRQKNASLEKKYLQMLAEHGEESERKAAMARLDAMKSK